MGIIKKKCVHCGKKIRRDFKYCPWCGVSYRKKEDYGMLGITDDLASQNLQKPSILSNILESTIKQLTNQIGKDLENMNFQEGIPKNFQIRLSTRVPQKAVIKEESHPEVFEQEVDEVERERRSKLKRVNVESKLRRLPEGLTYELITPGVKSKKDVLITKLEDSLEIRAYSKDRCYVKNIPLKVNNLKYSVKDEKVLVHIKT